MASADVEQTTADIEVKGRDGKPYGLRATGSVIQFDGFLKLYDEGRDDRQRGIEKGKDDKDGEDDDSRRLPPLDRGRPSQGPRHRGQPALHAAAAPLHRGVAGQAHGGTRHRPALDLRLDAWRRWSSATTSASTRSSWCPRTRAGSSRRSSRASSSATSNTTTRPASRRSSTSSPTTSSRGRTCCASSGASSRARSTRPRS